jgi:hypothetical protein
MKLQETISDISLVKIAAELCLKYWSQDRKTSNWENFFVKEMAYRLNEHTLEHDFSVNIGSYFALDHPRGHVSVI